eukprot:TRINITY_DN5015_c1_g1_i1.p1 TRINITY_DN5015_c1_g1~~TRINITY_DN5015_c1_g1_i1.p1  ORF type:complete len:542 (+),score=101.10 TRINITY_DN5015_c1_g1_i1:91-1716(+)
MANFLDELAYGSSETWRDYCDRKKPEIGANGMLVGPWADAIVAAVHCEKQGGARRFADGPAGQVIDYMHDRGHGKFGEAADRTEEAAHAGRLSAPSRPPDGRPICKYGKDCYRKNPEHLKEFAHPWQERPSGGGASAPSAPPSGHHGGGGGSIPMGLPVLQVKCGGCGRVFSATVPADKVRGATFRAQCPGCGAVNEAQAPGGSGPSAPPGRPGAMPTPAPRMSGPPKLTGRQRALLIGINYFGTQAELRGCINDVHNMSELLTHSFGWNPRDIRTMTDDDRDAMPTRANIEEGLRWLVHDVRPGDVLFFHFSGHGAQKEDPHGYEEDGMNETILPVDFQRAGQITDDELGDIIVKPLPEGVKLTAVMDCCHSGTGLDLPFSWTLGRGWREETNPFHSLGDVQMFSGCEDDDTSSDAATAYGAAGGAMTTAFCDVLRSHPCPSYPELMEMLNREMRHRGFSQRPQLTSSQMFEFNRPFILTDIMPNRNATIGRIFRRKFPPRPRHMEGPLADMLGIGLAAVGGMMLGEMVGGLLFGGGDLF